MNIDLNSDLGEGYGPWSLGDDAALLELVSSANVACGGHAGDPATMFSTLRRAGENSVTVGAHPGYADRTGFGRRVIPMRPEEAGWMIAAQIGALQAMAALAGTRVQYVKPHGALANLAADDTELARALAKAIRAVSPNLAVLAISGTALAHAAREAGLTTFSEIFADRAYLPDGRLVPRDREGAVLHEPEAAANRLLAFLDSGLMPVQGGAPVRLAADSICVHGDSPHALHMARGIRTRLLKAGITITPFLPPAGPS